MLATLYHRAPYPVRKAAHYIDATIRPTPKAYGAPFREYAQLLESSQWWSRAELEAYQLKQLQQLVEHAYANVPYYRDLWRKEKLEPRHIKTLHDVTHLPFLTKDDIRHNLDKLIATNIPPHARHYVTTGGSTAIPLGFYLEKRTNFIRMAFEWRNWNWAGYAYNHRTAILRGTVIDRFKNGERMWYDYEPREKALILSTYHMTDDRLPEYIAKLEAFRPTVLQGYPSALAILANFLKTSGTPFNTTGYLKAISTSSETLYPDQRTLIERCLSAPVYDKYGNSEQVTMIGQCAYRDGYHEHMEYSLTELVSGNRVSTGPNARGEIVGTAFTNYAVPFIRYRTQDMATLDDRPCACGRNLRRFAGIEGRLQELVMTRKGNLISMTALNMHSDVFDHVYQFQFYQDTIGEVVMSIIKRPNYTPEDEAAIFREVSKKFGPDITLTLRYVDTIPLTKRGKHRFLIQKLKVDHPYAQQTA